MDSSDDLRMDDGEETPERLKSQLLHVVATTAVQMRRVAGDALRAVGAHRNHFVVLAALAEFGPASQAALSGRTRIYKSDLVSVLNDLEACGSIRRALDPADKRRNIITITDDGRCRLAELERALDSVNERIMAPLGRDERAQLFDLLGRINARLASTPDSV